MLSYAPTVSVISKRAKSKFHELLSGPVAQPFNRYCNMDYLILSASHDRDVLDEVLTYDVSCQHSKHFLARMLGYARRLHLDITKVNIRHAIPKKHFPAHGPKHSIWSLNYLRWVGRTYGEWIEACWSCMNQLAASLKEMAPATRHEAMDCQWGAWNFQKLVNLGMFYHPSPYVYLTLL